MLVAPVTSARATPTEVSGYSDTTTRRLAGMTPTIGDSSSMVTSWSLILCQPGTVDFTTASSITGIAHAIFILIFRDAVDSFSRKNANIFGIVSYLYSQIFFLNP